MTEFTLEEIRLNYYEGKDLNEFLKDNAQPLEALAISDGAGKCFLHRCDFTKHYIKYKVTRQTLSIPVYVCGKCSRIYMEESGMDTYHAALEERNIPHKFYSLELTEKYLKSQMEDYVLAGDETLYIPEVWIEENPLCPVHEEKLFEIICVKTYKDRKVEFKGYICPRCGKIMIRSALAEDLYEKCTIIGVPPVKYEPAVREKPLHKITQKKETRPDFIIEDGKISPYTYDFVPECFMISGADTVVASDILCCGIDGHDTEENPALIQALLYDGTEKTYLFPSGYCPRCRKFYMDISDYETLYRTGRPEANLIRDFDDSTYEITSGEVFNLEEGHLKDLEDSIDSSVNKIKNSDDYVNPFATGDYDDGNLRFSKAVSRSKYEKRLAELSGYTRKPYSYRVDIASDDKSETYYIGVNDIIIDGKVQVISANSDFGHELINYQTLKITKDNTEYGIKLSREFKIDHARLYGYTNLKTDEDLIFKKGITDPFLVKVLNMRKRQHALTDIFVTIQENQNTVVNESIQYNIIVQGCAGSGKTMVLLHRLSSLAYRHKDFDFVQKAMILTPNESFSTHIKGLAEGLQIGAVARIPVERYYLDMLLEYDRAFKPDTGISSETSVPEVFTGYIYSDRFIDDFNRAYENVLEKRNALADDISLLYYETENGRPEINLNNNPAAFAQMKNALDSVKNIIEEKDKNVRAAQEDKAAIASRMRFLEENLPAAREAASEIISKTVSQFNGRIKTYIDSAQRSITGQEKALRDLTESYNRIKNQTILPGKRNRLNQTEQQIKKFQKSIANAKRRLDAEKAVMLKPLEGKTYEEVLLWMRQSAVYVKNMQDDIRQCEEKIKIYDSYAAESAEIEERLKNADEALSAAKEASFSEDIKQRCEKFSERLDGFSLMGMYQLVFDEAADPFKKENGIKKISGKCHRYDLYAQLLFAKKYFKKVNGNINLMFVDEGQDLAFNEYLLIYELNRQNMVYNIFGDTNQLMKEGRGISDWKPLVDKFKARVYTLNENYRNTNQITDFCNISFKMNVLKTGADGPAVREIPRSALEKELAGINISDESIAVLVPRSVRKKGFLDEALIPEEIREITGDKIDAGYISLKYVDEVKGIEFDRVYVQAGKMGRNEKYIALTRALTELILVVEEQTA